MRNLRVILCTCNQNIRKWPANPRIYVIALLVVGFLSMVERPIVTLCKMVSISVTPWVFPFFATEDYIRLMLMLGVALLFCDAPFIDSAQPYVIARSGKYRWVIGQILYIIVAAAIYFLFVFAISILMLNCHLMITSDWGKVIGTLAQTNAGTQLGMRMNFYTIFISYAPVHAMLLAFLMAWLCGIFLGLVIFTMNMYFKRSVGALIATGFILLDLFVNDATIGGLANGLYFSPISWANISKLDITGLSTNPGLLYAITVLLILIAVLIAVSVHAIRKKDIDVLPPV